MEAIKQDLTRHGKYIISRLLFVRQSSGFLGNRFAQKSSPKKQVCQVKGTQSAFAALKTDGTIVTWGCGTTGHVAEEKQNLYIILY